MYYELKLVYPRFKQFEASVTYKESITHCATITLYLRGIDSYQTSATRIAFERDQDRTLAALILADNPKFEVQFVEASKSLY